MVKTILLFDMDGVLLHADGYHRALQSSVKLIGRNIGIEEPILSKEHIAQFEAGGVTHEWETLAICTAILLTQIWSVDQNVRIPRIINPSPDNFLIKGEDKFTKFLLNIDLKGKSPTAYAESFLLEQEIDLYPEQINYLQLILRSGLDIDKSPTLPIFQEYVLGSQMYEQTYNFPSHLNTKSYLELYDREALTKTNHGKLCKWLEYEYQHAVIFTNRPSQPPKGFFSTPEAELGATAIGLQDMPILGAGSLSWLANLESKPLSTYYKPNPVHTLAAMLFAVGKPLVQALKTAVEFYNGNQDLDIWLSLDGTKIFVFEDLLPGFKSAEGAKQLLSNNGINVELFLVGISKHPVKITSLSQMAHCINEDINQGMLPEIIS